MLHKTIGIILGLLMVIIISGCASTEAVTTPSTTAPPTITESSPTPTAESTPNEPTPTPTPSLFKSELLKLVDNETPADELITKIYLEDELDPFFSLSELLQERPPECVRYVNDVLYIIYKYEGGSYLVLYPPSLEVEYIFRGWYVGKKTYLKDFEDLTSQEAFLVAVQEFDVYGDYIGFKLSSETIPESWHYTVDGYLICLTYQYEVGKPIIISGITVYGEDDEPPLHRSVPYMLPMDRELLTK